MTEVEKLYSLAGFTKRDIEHCNYNRHIRCTNDDCEDCAYLEIRFEYPPFTAEKQIELIKWLMNYPMLDEIRLYFNEPSKTYNIQVMSLPEECGYQSSYTERHNTFEQTIVNLICNLWQDLTESERKQIKEMLE